jgi:hypothetical protein
MGSYQGSQVQCEHHKGVGKVDGIVDGLVTSDEEVGKLFLSRKAWRLRINMIVKENQR